MVFNNVHPRLGGLHKIMNSSGSVGNLWWCRQNAIPDLIKHCKTKLLLPLHEAFDSAGKKEPYLRTRGSPRSLPYTKTRARGTTVTTTGASPYAALSAKVFARVILIRLQKLAERIFPESQCGFRAERSKIDMIFSLRQLQEKCREQHMPLYIAFIDLTKAFDLVSVAHPNCRA